MLMVELWLNANANVVTFHPEITSSLVNRSLQTKTQGDLQLRVAIVIDGFCVGGWVLQG